MLDLVCLCQLELVYFKRLCCIDCAEEMRVDQCKGRKKTEDNQLTMKKPPKKMKETQNEPRINLRQGERFI